MPRKPKPQPDPTIIEGMSTGMPLAVGGPMRDDFTGQPIPRVWPQAKPKTLASAQSVIDQTNVAKAKDAAKVLMAAGILKPKDRRRI